jgi:hypothetical protein
VTLTKPVEAEDRIEQSTNCHLLSASIIHQSLVARLPLGKRTLDESLRLAIVRYLFRLGAREELSLTFVGLRRNGVEGHPLHGFLCGIAPLVEGVGWH